MSANIKPASRGYRNGSITWFRRAFFLAVLGFSNPVLAAEPPASDGADFGSANIVVNADMAYQDLPGVAPERQRLDLYTRRDFVRAPIVLFAHGGSWQRGDKRAVGQKPLAFVPRGYVIASTNYRFRPEVPVTDMARDIAAALAWLRTNAATFGGDPDRLVLMGHSAGAHLVALVGTDRRLLAEAGVPWKSLRGVVSLDTGPYHVPNQMARLGITAESTPSGYAATMALVFDRDPQNWETASPWHQAEAGTPPFLVFASEGRADAALQARPFVEHLRKLGTDATFIEAIGRTHSTLNNLMGTPDDRTTEQVLAFLDRVTR